MNDAPVALALRSSDRVPIELDSRQVLQMLVHVEPLGAASNRTLPERPVQLDPVRMEQLLPGLVLRGFGVDHDAVEVEYQRVYHVGCAPGASGESK